MSTIKRITKNTLVYFLSNIATKILGFFFTMFTARYLGAEQFGILSFAVAFTALFYIFSDFGLYTLTVRELARDKSLVDKYLNNILIIKIIGVIITFGFIVISINLLGYSQEKITIVYILGLALVLDAFTSMFISIFQAFERMDYPSLGKVLHGTALLASTLFILHQRLNIIAFAIAYLFASAIELIYSLIVSAKKFMLPKLKIDASFSRWLIKESLAFWLTSIIGVIYFRADIIILSLMKGDTIVGWYNASRQLINALGFIHMSFLAALFPITSRFYISSAESLRFAFEKSFKYLLMLALPISVGTVLLADKFIFLIYGSEYNPSIIVLQIIIWAEMLIFINAVLSNLMFSINRQSLIAKLNLFAFAFNTFLNLLLIPNYSYIGASIALVASELFSVLYLFRYLEATEYRMSKKVFVNITSKISLASLVMGIFIWIFKDLNLGILIFLSIIVYLLVFITIKGFDEADLNLINKLLHKIKGSETL